MQRGEVAGWACIGIVSAALSWRAWSAAPPVTPPPPPPALPRQATPAELAVVRSLRDTLQADLDAATGRLGRPLSAGELEGVDPTGQPYLRGGLPDNPLQASIAAVLPRCPPTPQPSDSVDWIYCADSGQVQAVGLR